MGKCVQSLHALAHNVADMLIGEEMICHGYTEHLDGGHTLNVWYLLGQTISMLALAVCEYNFSQLGR